MRQTTQQRTHNNKNGRWLRPLYRRFQPFLLRKERIVWYDKRSNLFRIFKGANLLLTILMILDAIVCIILIASILGQEAKSAGMGGMGGGADTVFSSKARGMDALLARVTVVFAILFAVITIVIARMTN